MPGATVSRTAVLWKLVALATLGTALAGPARARNCEGIDSSLIVPVKSNPGPFEFSSIAEAIRITNADTAIGVPTHCILLYPNGAQDRIIQESIALPETSSQNGKQIFDVRIDVAEDSVNTGRVRWQPGPENPRTITLRPGPDPRFILPRPSYLSVEGIVFSGGAAFDPGGGAVLADKSVFVASDCEFRQNFANCGGALAAVGIITARKPILPARIEVQRCIFDTNLACQGGAIDVRLGAQAVVRDSQFLNNRAEAGAGLFVGAGLSEATVVDSEFTGGISNLLGGPFPVPISPTFCDDAMDALDPDAGICAYSRLQDGDQPEVSRFERKKSGGGVQTHGRFFGDRLRIHDNDMEGPGGGVYAEALGVVAEARLTNSLVTSNDGSAGDGIYIQHPTPAPTGTVTSTRTPFPTAVFTATPTPTSTFSFPVDTPTHTGTPTAPSPTATGTPTTTGTSTATPTATASPTGTINTPTPPRVPFYLWNDTIAGNGGQGIALSSGGVGGVPDVVNLVVVDNGDDLVGISEGIDSSLVEERGDPTPIFAAPGDYHYGSAASAGVDAGNPRVLSAATPVGSQDVDGEARVMGAQIDIGADELGTQTPPATATPSASATPTGPQVPAQPGGDSLPALLAVLALMLLFVRRIRRSEPHA